MLKIFYEKCIKFKISNKIYIGYSGGVDSSVLLNLCFNLFKKPKFSIRVININYLHNKNSKNWNIFCKTQCSNYKIPITTFFINSYLKNKNLEQEFRIIRYKIFLKLLNKSATFLLAHNSNDFLETFFLNLFRGCGIDGVLSMNEKLIYKNISILRPMINLDRNQILDYAFKNNINYITDFTNFDNNFNRNFLRYDLFNEIKKKWHNFNIPVLRYIHFVQCSELYSTYRYNFFFSKNKKHNNYLNFKNIKILPLYIRNNIIKIFIKKYYIKPLSNDHINELNKIIECKNKFAFVKINNFIFYRDLKNLYIKKIKKEVLSIKILKNIVLFKKIKNEKYLDFKINNIFLKNIKFNINKKTFIIIKYSYLLIVLSGIWKSKFYSIFLKNKFVIKILK
ncbi:MAG TPA: tRNA lysidine(34) synthetase TilS [Candidatus Azoamicus sp.]